MVPTTNIFIEGQFFKVASIWFWKNLVEKNLKERNKKYSLVHHFDNNNSPQVMFSQFYECLPKAHAH